MDEMFNALVYKQLDKIHKPVILFNIGGFYDPMLLQLDRMVTLVHAGKVSPELASCNKLPGSGISQVATYFAPGRCCVPPAFSPEDV